MFNNNNMKPIIVAVILGIVISTKHIHCHIICPTPSDDEPVMDCNGQCLQECPQNQTLVVDPCNCCFNKCVPQGCPEDICNNCPLVNCINGSIPAPNRICGCCRGCVIPNPGDPCYPTTYDDSLTCGESLECLDGECQVPNSQLVD